MSLDVTQLYIYSFGLLYILGSILFFVVVRKPIIEHIRKFFLIGKGYAYLNIIDNNKHVTTMFKKIKKPHFEYEGNRYMILPTKSVSQKRFPSYYYNKDQAQPIDFFDDEKLIGTDSERLDGFLDKAYSLGKLVQGKKMDYLLWAALAAAACGLLAAVISGMNWVNIDKLIQALL